LLFSDLKIKYQNPKSETISKSEGLKFKTKANLTSRFMFGSLLFWSFEFVSSFVFRISDLIDPFGQAP